MKAKKVAAIIAASVLALLAVVVGADQVGSRTGSQPARKTALVSYGTICRDVNLNGYAGGFAIQPHI
jgi:hypothetical protein